MDARRKQNLVIALVFIAAGALVVGTLIVSGGTGTVTNKAITRKPLLAKPGTMRENAKPIYTKAERDMPSGTAAPSGAGPGDSAEGGTGGASGEGEDLSGDSPPESREIREAFHAQTPEEGIEGLEQYLETLGTVAEASAVYTALGQLHARRSPPDHEAALLALETAVELAQTGKQAHDAALVQARLLANEDPAAALDVARNALDTHPEPTASGIQLAIKEGIILENSGDAKAAENAYKKAMESVEAAGGNLDSGTMAAYRQAGIRLSRLYRKTRRDDEANALARKMKLLNEM